MRTLSKCEFFKGEGESIMWLACVEKNSRNTFAGGKYTWGTVGQVYEEIEVDPNDPNYDSDAQV